MAAVVLGLFSTSGVLCAQEATIRVHADKLVSHVTRTMTGACLEDVNHEVYGGIYSQMIFGESFQEPPLPPPVRGFTSYGGQWRVHEGTVACDRGPGPKLIADEIELSTGEVGVEVLLPGNSRGVAGLVVKVREPGVGADNFIGYEIAVSAEPQLLRFGRHRHNWEHIKDVHCHVPKDQWVALVVRMRENGLEVLVDGKSVLTYEDRAHPLNSGRFGLRAFERACTYRNLWVTSGGRRKALAFEVVKPWDEHVSGMWRGLRRGSATGRFELVTQQPFVGRQSQKLTFAGGKGEVGIENRGLNRWGMHFVEGKPYDGLLWLRSAEPVDVAVALESGDGGRILAQSRVHVPGGNNWCRAPFTLVPRATADAGRFAVKLDRPGSVEVGYAFLQPGAWGRYKDLPVRKDVALALVAQGLTVLRYGGSMVNAPEYRWKKMIGPRDRRPPYRGTWYPDSSNGWGIVDFVAFCEAAGFLAVPAFNMDETPQDMADFVEYMNGSPESVWGRKRAADGHAAPFHLKHLELGNEEAVNEDYWRRFHGLAEAIWAKDPHIVLVVGDFAYNGRIKDPFHFTGAPSINTLAAHKKILEFARARGQAVWFDVHIWNHEPRNPNELGGGIIGLEDFAVALKQLCAGAEFKVCVFEENAVNHTLRRGLAHAHAVNKLQRMGDLVPIVCAANCLQPDHQNDNGWDQGLLFLNPSRVWGQPSYFVTQMMAQNYLPLCVRTDVHSPGNALDVTARRSDDGGTLLLQVVNVENRPIPCQIALDGFSPAMATGKRIEISGQLGDENTAENPHRIVPREKPWQHGTKSGRLQTRFAPQSFTILRLQ
ncbi:MAG TPA: alpha-L-arabinofuranosidase C-terminal domain-containing protein [Gemmataceae bacterium]|nr:alpha-L-arabinofuranosidase C-terminal domain-containing protein [Gemmataceae bacterium]